MRCFFVDSTTNGLNFGWSFILAKPTPKGYATAAKRITKGLFEVD